MKGLFKSKPRTLADVVRQTHELLIFLSPALRQAVLLLGQEALKQQAVAVQKHSNRHNNSPEAQQQSTSEIQFYLKILGAGILREQESTSEIQFSSSCSRSTTARAFFCLVWTD
ncbi:hypothetical protein GUJ93_ZPchr0266g14229 [Zizania palustris]|uniref:Uncharacterized protein n=1 Tax=Zizania palustris TaxID=103762 RepID=A0A8J5UZ75_ZIZPA|nr:hypothetical protein GUJ93_ZPchr0266g14229 [Zizania palustris]